MLFIDGIHWWYALIPLACFCDQGKLTSFKEFASLASNLAGFNPEVSGTSSKPEGVFARGGDTTLQLKMKFKPKISFEDGIKRALNSNLKLY